MSSIVRRVGRRSTLLLVWILAVVGLVPGAPALAADHGGVVAPDPVDGTISFVDGEVLALTEVGGKVIAGGNFTHVGPGLLGAAGVVDLASGAFVEGFADVDGVVTTVASDGAGGWYLGGEFASVGGQPRNNAAHVDATGAVTAFDPAPNGRVETLVVSPEGVVIGGTFTTAGGASRSNLALSDAATGLAVPGWDPVVSGPVLDVVLSGDGTLLYLGGDFLKVDGVSRKRLAAIAAPTGELDATFLPGTPNLAVRTVAELNGTLYLGGDFTTVGGVARRRVAAVEATTGALLATDPGVNGRVEDITVSSDGSSLFIVGAFSTVGGQARSLVAGLSTSTLAPTSLTVAGIYGTVDAVAVLDTGRVVIGGTFHIVPKKGNPQRLATVSTSTGAVTALVAPAATPASLTRTARATTGVQSLAISQGRLAVGGDFSDYGVIARPYLVAMDATTGALDREFSPLPTNRCSQSRARSTAPRSTSGASSCTSAVRPLPRCQARSRDRPTGARVLCIGQRGRPQPCPGRRPGLPGRIVHQHYRNGALQLRCSRRHHRCHRSHRRPADLQPDRTLGGWRGEGNGSHVRREQAHAGLQRGKDRRPEPSGSRPSRSDDQPGLGQRVVHHPLRLPVQDWGYASPDARHSHVTGRLVRGCRHQWGQLPAGLRHRRCVPRRLHRLGAAHLDQQDA